MRKTIRKIERYQLFFAEEDPETLLLQVIQKSDFAAAVTCRKAAFPFVLIVAKKKKKIINKKRNS
jgi:hypothetical protein